MAHPHSTIGVAVRWIADLAIVNLAQFPYCCQTADGRYKGGQQQSGEQTIFKYLEDEARRDDLNTEMISMSTKRLTAYW